ncbi:MAG: hypothetical protein E6H67_00050 [Betaproteobacteria bacterium]|nr:MAG: hypothetical protein E6H67_00050 [Betaproteobacteria bacterium]
MRRVSKQAILGTVALGALLGGCATTVEMGPGFYHYDVTPAHSRAPVVYQQPTVVYQEPAVVYSEPAVVYRAPTVVYRGAYSEPAVVYRVSREAAPYRDHGQ